MCMLCPKQLVLDKVLQVLHKWNGDSFASVVDGGGIGSLMNGCPVGNICLLINTLRVGISQRLLLLLERYLRTTRQCAQISCARMYVVHTYCARMLCTDVVHACCARMLCIHVVSACCGHMASAWQAVPRVCTCMFCKAGSAMSASQHRIMSQGGHVWTVQVPSRQSVQHAQKARIGSQDQQ